MGHQNPKQVIIELAETYKNRPDQFIDVLDNGYQEVPNHKKAEAFFWSGSVLYENQYYDLALETWLQSLYYYTYVSTKDKAGRAACYGNIGNAFKEIGNYDKAIEFHYKALDLEKEIGARLEESRSYTNLGIAYKNLGNYDKAIELHKKALAIKEDKNINDFYGIPNCYNNLGLAYAGLGDLGRAIDYYEKGIQTAIAVSKEFVECACYINIGTVYHAIGEFQKAIDNFRKAQKIAVEKNFRNEMLRCDSNIGSIYLLIGELEKAKDYFEKALHLAEQQNDKVGESTCCTNLGNVYSKLKEKGKAIKYHQKAIVISQKIKDRDGEARSYLALGDFYFAFKQTGAASDCYKKALKIAGKIGNINLQRKVSMNIGTAFLRRDPQNAYHFLKRSIDLTEAIGSKLVDESYKVGFYSVSSDAYPDIILLCLRSGRKKKAFEFLERSKSRALLDIIAATEVKPTVELTPPLTTLLEEEDKLLSRLREIQTRHMRDPAPTTKLGEVDSILKGLDDIYGKIKEFDSEYAYLKSRRPINIPRLQKILAGIENSLLIEYFIANDKLLIFCISNEGFHLKQVLLRETELDCYIDNYWREIANFNPKNSRKDVWLELSRYLIKPISEQVSNAKLIYIVPYGKLHYIPIHALKIRDEPLIEKHAVVYSPSASLLQFHRKRGSRLIRSCASFGVALGEKDKVIEREAEEIAKLFGGNAKLAATKKDVLKNIHNDILHFSCHGYFDNDDPLSSGIMLSNNEIFSAREIFELQLKLDTELVTLSACQTGVNEIRPGDELIGFIRTLLYAGASSTVVSLWSEEAYSTVHLMTEFYRLVKNGKDKAHALQEAQKKVMRIAKYSHPFFWAPFVLIGDWK